MTVNVGFVGAGGIAELHVATLTKLAGVKVAAVCDSDSVRANRLAEPFGAAVHYEALNMLENVKLDCLYVCLPPFAHGQIEERAAEKGVHLFLEKPLGLSMERVARKVQAVTEAGVITSVGYHWRYFEHVARAREILGDRPVALALGTWLSGMPETAWWRVRTKSGGQLHEQNTHMVDLARYFLGNVQNLQGGAFAGILAEHVPDYDIDDACAMVARFLTGTLGAFLATDVFPGFDVGLKLFAQDLMLHVTLDGLVVHEKGKRTELRTGNDPYQAEDRVFIEAVRTGDAGEIRSTLADAFGTFAATMTANEAMTSGKALAVPELKDVLA